MGMVIHGINNIFTVFKDGETLECVIKGKILKDTGKVYAPLAPGDMVDLDRSENGISRITARRERSSEFCRWNKKRKAPQTIAANVDQVICVCSADSPPFRPRFIDRIHVTSEIERIPFLVVINKIDKGIPKDMEERLAVYESTGCAVVRCSAKEEKKIDELEAAIAGKRSVFCGQSGVGKSSLLNLLIPGIDRKIGSISAKYNRGKHTTRFGTLVFHPSGGWIVDTPGIREFEIVDIEPTELSFFFPEMVSFRENCVSRACTHDHEPECAVLDAVERGDIHEDRFESYLRMLDSLRDRGVIYG
ncbi:MAG: ribosome small subunit-dependent GTPase A [Spirochaetales bacterium]|jgi:ribosome biogenesis GTPase / thiamine phosphate phosphatase|nr:ribosome small subunit-dependent GTPase A [Spirochaetales bacterium]